MVQIVEEYDDFHPLFMVYFRKVFWVLHVRSGGQRGSPVCANNFSPFRNTFSSLISSSLEICTNTSSKATLWYLKWKHSWAWRVLWDLCPFWPRYSSAQQKTNWELLDSHFRNLITWVPIHLCFSLMSLCRWSIYSFIWKLKFTAVLILLHSDSEIMVWKGEETDGIWQVPVC